MRDYTAYLRPNRPATPSKDLQRDPDYLALRAQIAQHGAPLPQATPWHDIEAAAAQLLRQHCDLRVACYLALAHVSLDGAQAAAPALTFLTALMSDDDEVMTPPLNRPRARQGALGWLHEQLSAALRSIPTSYDESTRAAAGSLDTAVRAQLGDGLPAFVALVAQAPAPIPPSPAPAPAAVAPTATLPAPLPGSAAQAGAAQPLLPLPGADNLVALGQLLLAQANRRLEQEPFDLGALRLRRQGLWLHIQAAPPAVGENTRIVPLPAGLAAHLAAQAACGDWAALLSAAEEAMPRHRLVLALQRHSAQALSQLNAAPQAAAIAADSLALLARLPTLVSARASDGTPLLDDATRAWLEAAQPLARLAPTSAPAPSLSSEAPGPGAEDVRAPRIQAAFVAQLGRLEAMAGLEAAQLSAALFRRLGRTLRTTPAMLWEPQLAQRVWAGEAAALALVPDSPKRRGRLAALLSRIGESDVQAAHQLARKLYHSGVSP